MAPHPGPLPASGERGNRAAMGEGLRFNRVRYLDTDLNPIASKSSAQKLKNRGILFGNKPRFLGLDLEMARGALWCSFQALFDLGPIGHIPPSGNVVGAAVLILQVIGVFPDIQSENGIFTFHHRAILIRR